MAGLFPKFRQIILVRVCKATNRKFTSFRWPHTLYDPGYTRRPKK